MLIPSANQEPDSSTGSTKWLHRKMIRSCNCRYRLGWLSTGAGSTYREYGGNAGTKLFSIRCTQDSVENWNIAKTYVTSELKKLSSSMKTKTVFPKFSTLLSGCEVWTWGIYHMMDNTWRAGATSWIEDSNAIFWEQWTKWLPGFFIILHLLLVSAV